MHCGKVQQRLDLFATKELAPSMHEEIEAHLESCPECRQALARLRRLEDLLTASSAPPVPEGFSARVVARAKERQAGVARSSPMPHGSLWPAWKRLGVSTGPAAALAVGLFVGMFMGQETWRVVDRPVPAVMAGLADPLAASGFEYLVEPGGNSLAQAYVQLTTAADR
jgi:anti-sigma factor RsiW